MKQKRWADQLLQNKMVKMNRCGSRIIMNENEQMYQLRDKNGQTRFFLKNPPMGDTLKKGYKKVEIKAL